ncbi:MAG: thiamine-phosphate kinase [Anaerohalosphaeraceae bacterium]|nr:thiamine-phosphate kinase [Anaerohalosphaeraceae bacterium]
MEKNAERKMSTGENEITKWFAANSTADGERFPIGIGDDMAQLNLGGGKSVLITTDMLLDGVHFDLEKAGFESVGYKAMAVSLSDCAAMATLPVAAVVSVALPRGVSIGAGSEELKLLHKGIVRAGEMFDCELIGGDITSWPKPFAINVAMLSEPGPTEPVRRSGAKAGDCLCVTGLLGGSPAGKHLHFVPRVNEAIAIAQAGATAMMDISDGLSTDLNRLCTNSGVGAIVEAVKVPISDQAKKAEAPLAAALNDGEDFELLFTISEDNFQGLMGKWDMEVPVTQIGVVNNSGRVCIKNVSGEVSELVSGGFDHLREKR